MLAIPQVSFSSVRLGLGFEAPVLEGQLFDNGSSLSGGFRFSGIYFNNTFTDYGGGFFGWSGWSHSAVVDSSTPGFTNQYAAMPGGGSDPLTAAAVPGSQYLIGFAPSAGAAFFSLPPGATGRPISVDITNTTYAALSMWLGDDFAKKFGGEDGTDPDTFRLFMVGYNEAGEAQAEIEVLLADYRPQDSSMDTILTEWKRCDLTTLGTGITRIGFRLESTDIGAFGMNTPSYFAIDNLTIEVAGQVVDFSAYPLPEAGFANGAMANGGFMVDGFRFNNQFTDFGGGFTGWEGWALSNLGDTLTAGFGNQYSVITGGGVNKNGLVESGNPFGIGYAGYSAAPLISMPEGTLGRPLCAYITNTTYTALSMLEGDDFAKKFGGEDGTNPDFLDLTLTGYDPMDNITGTVTVSLADFRPEDSARDRILTSWKLVDLTGLGAGVERIEASFDSSDKGEFGINTPTYFAIDRLEVALEPHLIADAAYLGSGWKQSSWFGLFYDTYAPDIYHYLTGWWQVQGSLSSGDGFWLRSYSSGEYYWSSMSEFPHLFRLSDQSWLYLDLVQSDPSALRIYSYATDTWAENVPGL